MSFGDVVYFKETPDSFMSMAFVVEDKKDAVLAVRIGGEVEVKKENILMTCDSTMGTVEMTHEYYHYHRP